MWTLSTMFTYYFTDLWREIKISDDIFDKFFFFVNFPQMNALCRGLHQNRLSANLLGKLKSFEYLLDCDSILLPTVNSSLWLLMNWLVSWLVDGFAA